MRLWRIYRLYDSDTRYIGITSCSLDTRLAYHHRDPNRRGMQIEQIDTCRGTRKQAEARERVWIYRYLLQGAPLLNIIGIVGDRSRFIKWLRTGLTGQKVV